MYNFCLKIKTNQYVKKIAKAKKCGNVSHLFIFCNILRSYFERCSLTNDGHIVGLSFNLRLQLRLCTPVRHIRVGSADAAMQAKLMNRYIC